MLWGAHNTDIRNTQCILNVCCKRGTQEFLRRDQREEARSLFLFSGWYCWTLLIVSPLDKNQHYALRDYNISVAYWVSSIVLALQREAMFDLGLKRKLHKVEGALILQWTFIPGIIWHWFIWSSFLLTERPIN